MTQGAYFRTWIAAHAHQGDAATLAQRLSPLKALETCHNALRNQSRKAVQMNQKVNSCLET